MIKKNPFALMLFITGGLCLLAFKPLWFKKQGIEGYLFKVSGNQMPSPDIRPAPPAAVRGSLYVYELTNINQVVQKSGSPFYSAITTRFIKKIDTNRNGHFSSKLPAGKYSLFVKKDLLFYSNSFDTQNNIHPVEVLPGKMTKVEFRMDYDAVY